MNRVNPSLPIAEQLYVGLHCSDCACQTEDEEIVPLKSTTELLTTLYREVQALKSELNFTRDSLRSSFYEELQANGQQIYYQLTDRLDVLRKNHSKALETLRLSYRSQLHDFISQARNIINTKADRQNPTESEERTLSIPWPSANVATKETTGVKQKVSAENREKNFFQQAAIKGYENEINNLKKEIEQLQESTRHEIKIATTFLTDERDRLAKELATVNRSTAQFEDTLAKKDEQIRDLKRDISSLQSRLKESKKVTMREPTPTPPIVTQSRLAQTDPWQPPAPSPVEKHDEPNKEYQNMMENKFELFEQKYQNIISQKNAQVQQLMQELDSQQKTFKLKMDKYLQMEERHRQEMRRNAEKHKQDVQVWETKYDILKKSMMVLRDEMYTRQTHVRDRFTVKPAVVTYN